MNSILVNLIRDEFNRGEINHYFFKVNLIAMNLVERTKSGLTRCASQNTFKYNFGRTSTTFKTTFSKFHLIVYSNFVKILKIGNN